jgi:polyhydroxybutyrate depolymerase
LSPHLWDDIWVCVDYGRSDMKVITSIVLFFGGGLLLAGVWGHQTQAQPLNLPIYAQRPTGWQEGTLAQGTTTRYFRYYLPRNLPKNAPVVILLHGGTQSMRRIFEPRAGGTQAWPPLAESEKFLLLVPNGVNAETGDTQGNRQNWNDCRPSVTGNRTNTGADDVGFMRQLIAWAASQHSIDPNRVYATGASNGGLMSYRLGIELSNQIAAVAAFIANMPAGSECQNAPRPIPMMIANGTADPIMPPAGGEVRGVGGRVLSTAQTVEYWLRANRSAIRFGQTRQLPEMNRRDGSSVTATLYPARPSGAEVLFYSIEGGGHTMPSIQYLIPAALQRTLVGSQNQDIEGAQVAWSFLSRQRLAR